MALHPTRAAATICTQPRADGARRHAFASGWSRRFFLLTLTLSVLVANPAPVEARCQTRADLSDLSASILATARCAARGQLNCASAHAAPACAPELPAAIFALISDERPPQTGPAPALDPDRAQKCQAAIASGVARAALARLQHQIVGQPLKRDPRLFSTIVFLCLDKNPGAAVPSNYSREPEHAACLTTAAAAAPGRSGSVFARCLVNRVAALVDSVAPRHHQPNILLILTDDQRPEMLDAMPETLARIAGEGLRFRNAFTTTAICAPSRASLLTGRHAHRHGLVGNGGAATLDHAETLGPQLAAVGYRTGYFGKYLNDTLALGERTLPGWNAWHTFLEAAGGAFYGFRLNQNGRFREFPATDYSTDVLAELTERFVRSNADQPFFAVFAPFAPHDPAIPAARHVGLFDALPDWRPPNWQESDVSRKPAYVRWHQSQVTPGTIDARDALRRREFESLVSVDEAVGRLLDLLETLGLADDTLVVFTSDHGLHWGEHWLGTKFTSYEEAIRVPLLMRGPGVEAGEREQMVAGIDLAPTLLQLAGTAPIHKSDGQSLVSLLAGAAGPFRRELLIQNSSGLIVQPNRAIRTSRWKYIETQEDAGPSLELYDLASDPFELENLVDDPARAPLVERLARRLGALASRR